MAIECGGFRLREWRAGDEESLVRHANDREIWLNMRDRFPHPYTEADAASWIAIATARTPAANLAIEIDGEAAGGIGLMLHEDVERVSAEIGYWLGRAFWGRGVTSAAVRAMTTYGFESFGLTRIFAVPFARNAPSARVLEKAGYAREGVMRRSAIKDGEILDQLLYAITDLDPLPPA